MKYIDADILQEKITDLCINANYYQQKAMEESNREDFVSSGGEIFAYKKVLSLIDSLQQEQPKKFTDFEWLVGNLMFRGCDLEGMTDGEDDNGTVTKLIKDRAVEMMALLERELEPNTEPVDLEKEVNFEQIKKMIGQTEEHSVPTCRTCIFYENNCPKIRGKFVPYPIRVCKDYTYEIDEMLDKERLQLEAMESRKHKITDAKIKIDLPTSFMNYLDRICPEGKMCLSNAECSDIDKAFDEMDWDKLVRYLKKYLQFEVNNTMSQTLEQVAEVMTREKLLTILQDASRVIYMAESWAYSNSKLAELCKARKQLKEVILHLNNGGKIDYEQ